MFEISKFTENDADQWHKLWTGYQKDENLTDEEIQAQVSANWPRILNDPNCYTNVLRLEKTGEAVGFTNFVSTWSRTKPQDECYLCDLYVSEEYQGNGGGKMLINSVIDFARENNLNNVHWITEHHNKKAQKLYDKLAQGKKWLKYRVEVK